MAPADPSLTSLTSPTSAAAAAANAASSGRRRSSDHVRIAAAVSLSSIREAIQEEDESRRSQAAVAVANDLEDDEDRPASAASSSTTTSVSIEVAANGSDEDHLLFHVSRSYNRLSLKSRRIRSSGKRKLPDLDSIVQDDPTEQTATKKSRLETANCPSEEDSSNRDQTMNGHSSKLLESRFASSSSGMSSLGSAATGSGGSGVTKGSNPPPVASLSNLGNTCFLNSVLYTLRFTPGFLHSLHHLVYDLGLQGGSSNGSGNGGKKRSGGSSSSSANGNSSSINANGNGGIADADTELVHDVVDQLHDLFKTMSCSDETPENNREPIPPNTFLQAVGKLNPMFEGNQQQDAHELLVTVLNTLQDIKIPIPVVAASATDAVDGSSVSGSATNGHKVKSKKSGKSIFYSGSSNGVSSNGIRSNSKTDQVNNIRNNLGSGGEASYLPNFVRDNFVGKSVMGTRCLECEASTFRSETFTNIDIPLTFDDQDDPEGMSVKDLFLKQIMASETLRENNKYWCSECSRLNEAQRSVQYEVLPKVMVLQLKRFTASGNKSYTSKINEYIPTPFTMNCFCTQCMPGGPSSAGGGTAPTPSKHHYRLYAVIMHLGATLASGHYTAYVRASSEMALEYIQCNRSNSVERKGNKSGGSKGIMKYFSRSSEQRAGGGGLSASGHNGMSSYTGNSNGTAALTDTSGGGCRSSGCCGVRTCSLLSLPSDSGGGVSTTGSSVSMGSIGSGSGSSGLASSSNSHHTNGHHHQRSVDSVDSGACTADSVDQDPDETWLECDDETIHVISRRQFEEDLSCNRGFTTPYLLFYQRV